MSRIKIVATIGPVTATTDAVRALVDAGMDVARLNGAHGDVDWHYRAIDMVRSAESTLPILLDIPGRKIRTGRLRHEPNFGPGDIVTLTTDTGHDGRTKVPITYPNLHRVVQPGQRISIDDGTLAFVVEEVRGQDIFCRADNEGTLRAGKGINIPGITGRIPIVGERDLELLALASRCGVDFVGVSFVEESSDIEQVRTVIGKTVPRVLAKIENQTAVENLKDIAAAADALMIDRGDLSSEAQVERVALLQKEILSVARRTATPVVVATEMLHSMVQRPVPTKAEVSDITNAVFDGAAALMLSAETAIGRYPAQAVSMMRSVADAAWDELQARADDLATGGAVAIPEAIEDAIALISRRLPVTKIVAITMSGYAARMVAARRPRQPILAVSNDPAAARSFNLLPGTEGVYVDIPFSRTSMNHIARCLEELWRQGKIRESDLILVTSVGYPRSGNRMNLIQTHVVADLKESLGWRE